ncbi:DNA cytosine methyltransferase [Prosthecomicrobium hirschii]|uniref:DNA cytosine methyltransferase n=1 Tax=Prosthecodimorpha hirschii TaxID=665126 RepID=UPI00221F4FB4|nr:DNA cytosine methyltransferase [Prosthecomicrobium hirschii]MCW1842307.1 DNA cytosine methyltransferase [Prosthecomicrobium hirschii]
MDKIQAVDLFCGVGGLAHGLRRAGIDVRLGIDKDPACRFPFEFNNNAKFIEADVFELHAQIVTDAFTANGLRLLAGCAPCQPFSTYSRNAKRTDLIQRKGRGRADDWQLLRRFGDLAEAIQPDLITMENVPPLLDQVVFHEFVDKIRARYHVAFRVVECEEIGLPQTRRRLVFVASKLGPITIPSFNAPRRTVRDAIGALPPIAAGEVSQADPLHRASRLSPINLERIKSSRPGGTWRDWPEALRAACHNKLSGITYPSVYGRMEWDAPAPTITTQAFGFGNGRFGHPEQDRAISLREAAMLQGFPEKYCFVNETKNIAFATLGRLIGNAVPVPLGEFIGNLFLDHVRLYTSS